MRTSVKCAASVALITDMCIHSNSCENRHSNPSWANERVRVGKTSTNRQPSTTCSTSLPAQHLRLLGLFWQVRNKNLSQTCRRR